MDRRSMTKSGPNKRQENAESFYKRVHGTDEQSGGEKQGKRYYYAAAEDDKLGWSLGDERIDPMYTMRRREQEQDAHSKDSFYKRLKVRIGQGDVESSEAEPKAAETLSTAIKASTPSTGAMRFGFGMMSSTPAAAASKPDAKEKSKSKKDKKDKKSKDKTSCEKGSKKEKKHKS
ncbi:hypothetical protein IWW37_004226 [Coemansia sp. RSA 2050]|nr:hypothetical protein IWW37_004226 [Coemansia sp. RSA 2050]KAJ2731771.1 hypothetical protein IW152_004311 [Coemansia sp. BCRC 34962]